MLWIGIGIAVALTLFAMLTPDETCEACGSKKLMDGMGWTMCRECGHFQGDDLGGEQQ